MTIVNTNGKQDLVNLIQTIWAPSFYAKLRQNLVLASLFEREYEGVIAARGDKVKVNQLSLGPAETLTDDKRKFKSNPLTVNQFELTVNRQTVHAVDLTNLSVLQSQSFMNDLKDEMTFQMFLKMETEIAAYYKSEVAQVVNPVTASDYDSVDIAKMRTLASRAKLPKDGRIMALSPEYYGDLLTKKQIISQDYVDGRPLANSSVPNLLGFGILEAEALGVDTGMVFHKSCLQLAMQQGLNFSIVDKMANNELVHMIVCTIVWDMKMFDANRAWFVKEA